MKTYLTMHVGLDDTDSKKRGCTTHLTALLIEELEKFNVQFIDYPSLVRLNPNVPWKTRGNGALCLRFNYKANSEEEIKQCIMKLWKKHSDINEKGTDPGVVFLTQAQIPKEFNVFSKKAQMSIVTLKEALKIIEKFGCEAFGFNSRRGIIGSLAAIGETFENDYTYELIAYRSTHNLGSERRVNEDSIFEMDELTQPYTFNNVDLEKHRVIITPRGPDPILFGIRGESPEIVKEAYSRVKPLETVERWVIFRSNQGTDGHLIEVNRLEQIEPYSSVIVKGIVSQNPRVVPLRHIIFSIEDETGEADCAAFEPTGDLRKAARELIEGDLVEVYGAVHKRLDDKTLTINLEKINILQLTPKKLVENPFCPSCGKRLKSMGKNQGFRCEKCGGKFSNLHKKESVIARSLRDGLYVTSTRSQRHLTKPLRRYGLEKHGLREELMLEEWHCP